MTDPRDARIAELEAQVRDYMRACKEAGICMSCILGSPDPIGCVDCLGTGWDGGSPVGFVPEAARDALLEKAVEAEREACARIAEKHSGSFTSDESVGQTLARNYKRIAASIRARAARDAILSAKKG